jgi:hypothetical protein
MKRRARDNRYFIQVGDTHLEDATYSQSQGKWYITVSGTFRK